MSSTSDLVYLNRYGLGLGLGLGGGGGGGGLGGVGGGLGLGGTTCIQLMDELATSPPTKFTSYIMRFEPPIGGHLCT